MIINLTKLLDIPARVKRDAQLETADASSFIKEDCESTSPDGAYSFELFTADNING